MSGALQAVFQNQRSFVLPLPAIGAAYEGGFFAGQISTAGNGIADYNLVVGPVASAENSSIKYKIINTGGDPTSVIDGPTNSSTMNDATHPAAQFCEGLTIGGFSDWYMPAKNELEVCYFNLKPTTQTNTTANGSNTNAVPSRGSNYTSGTPAQTTAAIFQSTGAETFGSGGGIYYWSSSQSTSNNLNVFLQYFFNGSQFLDYKFRTYRVRAVRRVAV